MPDGLGQPLLIEVSCTMEVQGDFLKLSLRGEEQIAGLTRARGLWSGEPLPEERYSTWAVGYREHLVDRYVARLREKLGGPELIRTVRGVGFMLDV